MPEVRYKNFVLEYEIFGSGTEALIAFHGYGRSASDFKLFESSLGKKYRIYSFNLLYHGNSRIENPQPLCSFEQSDLQAIVDRCLIENHIQSFSLMGYSLGAKFALLCVEMFPGKINSLLLFAPDGLKSNWLYQFASQTRLGRRVCKRVVKDANLLFLVMKTLRNLKLINDRIYRFVEFHMETREKRQMVCDVWLVFRNLKPDKVRIRKLINRYHISSRFIFGKYDLVIPPRIGEHFCRGLNDPQALLIVEMGHKLINEEMSAYIEKHALI